MSWQVQTFARLASTMTEARAQALAGAPHGTCIVAHSQAEGRGRRGRSWVSLPDAGLWLTALVRPQARLDELSLAPLIAGIAVGRAVEQLGVTGAGLKWPNDVLVEGRKLAGILVEAEALASGHPWLLVGVGLNLAATATVAAALPADVAARYIGVADRLAPAALPAPALLHAQACSVLLEALQDAFDTWQEHGMGRLWPTWDRLDALRGATVRAEAPGGTGWEGVAEGLDPAGRLRLRTADGIRLVQTGEVERLHYDRKNAG